MVTKPRVNLDDLMDFLLETAKDLIECGCSSNRVEKLIGRIAEPLGVQVDALAMPTGVWIKIACNGDSKIDLIRVRTWAVNLDKLTNISDIVDEFELGRLNLIEAKRLIRDASQKDTPYPLWVTMLAGGMSAFVLVYLLGGSMTECWLSLIPGSSVQFLTKFVFVGENQRYLADFVSASLVGFYSIWCSTVLNDIDAARIIVGGIVGLLPGLVLVNAIHELAQKNLLSGAAKSFEAMVISASLAFGVLLAVGLYLVVD
jgi:uncharacterized membrane protein YjjP (DUF1212 family)